MGNTIRLAGIVEESFTDGVGIRYTVFTQGCLHGCSGCHNPETWDFNAGIDYNIVELVDNMLENPLLDGVTISGGDPMYRVEEILNLIHEIKSRTNLNIWLYTGFTYEECIEDPGRHEILKNIDVLVDGEYKCSLRSLHLRFRGSSNQRIIDVQKSLDTGEIVLLITD